ncbi:hypothetical protein LCGC14_2395390 [marine sediment metagenome]|uniref:Uncharacterized protein n=1 Tax=marine sediment metagenome TaxID=412755 RepID=A0A0F9ERC7_9ZZZZ
MASYIIIKGKQMPRIRRWFHVSHDINSDPEVWELTDRFGDRAYRVWIEILSIADRYDGLVPGEHNYLCISIGAKNKVRSSTVNRVLEYATEKHGWYMTRLEGFVTI